MANDLDTYLDTLSPDIRALVVKTREFVKATLPDLQERVHLGYGSILYGPGSGKMSDDVCYIAGHSKDVNLGFNYGTSLPDPKGLLKGTGKNMRHVKIKKAEQLEDPALVDLLRAAVAQAVK